MLRCLGMNEQQNKRTSKNLEVLLKLECGNDLSSREAALRVLSAIKVFTTVFGMGTGGIPSLGHRKSFCVFNFQFQYTESCIEYKEPIWCLKIISIIFRKSPRPISNTQLHLLPNFYLCPINVVICNGTY